MSGKLAASVMTVAKDQLRYWEILEKSVVTVNWFGCFCFFSMCISILLPLEGRLPFPFVHKKCKNSFLCTCKEMLLLCFLSLYSDTHTHLGSNIFEKMENRWGPKKSRHRRISCCIKTKHTTNKQKNENQNQTKQRYKADKISWRSNQASSIVGAMTSQRFQFHLKTYLGAWVSISQALKWASFYFH